MSARVKVAPGAGRQGGAARPAEKRVVEGQVVGVLDDGRAVLLVGGRRLACRVPQHVSIAWLRAALARAPIDAEAAVSADGGNPSLWSVFPGPAHEGAAPETVEIAASERIELVCGTSRLSVKRDEVRTRGREVFVTGTRATRIRGGTIKIN